MGGFCSLSPQASSECVRLVLFIAAYLAHPMRAVAQTLMVTMRRLRSTTGPDLRYAIEKAINQTGYQKLRNQKKASYIKLAAMLFSSAATVLLGLKGVGSEQVFKNIAFVFSASVTLLTALEPFFNFRSFWVEHEIAQGRFLGLRADLDF